MATFQLFLQSGLAKDLSAPLYIHTYIHTYTPYIYTYHTYIYTECNRRNGPDFGRVFLRSYYTDITKNTYIQSSMVTEILAREV